jgi:transcriptional regulator with XRE-family HTH domain
MPRRTLESLGRLVREKRGKKKIRETAKEIGIGTATLMRIENGRIPDLETFGRVCKWLNMDPGSFLGFESKSPLPPEETVQNVLTSISVHFKADQNPQPATVQAIAQMVRFAITTQPQQTDPDL